MDAPEPGEPRPRVLRGVRVLRAAHGGHCVARHEGQVVFVRHAAPGELVDVEVTQERSKFLRGDAVAVLQAADGRRTPPCPIAGQCGGCDFQHLVPAASREVKRQVVAELLGHVGVAFDGEVEAAPVDDLGWRTRMRYHDADGRPGLMAHRSRQAVALPEGGCRIACGGIADPDTPGVAALTADGPVLRPESDARDQVVRQVATGRSFDVRLDGFWQPHTSAPDTLTQAVLEAAEPTPDAVVFDLYAGVGVFAGALADAGCRVWGVEGQRDAVELAARNVPGATFVAGDVARVLPRLPARADAVVLDPPRAGAGASVMARLCATHPRVIVYVACDPAALARDLAFAGQHGYAASAVRAVDLFPNTRHVECVATLRAGSSS